MVADLIRKNHCYQLGDTGKDQVGMQGLFILGTASRKTEILLDVIDLPFNSSPDLIGVMPFVSSADGSGIGTQVSFGIDINHASAPGGSAGIVAETFPMALASGFVVTPFHLWTNELEGRDAAP